MCGIAGYSLRPRSNHRADAGCAGTARRDRRARGRCRRLRLPGPGGHLRDGREAADARVRAPRASAVPESANQLLVHVRDYTKGHPVDQRQQPPRAPRAGRRDPQRDHPERRRAPRPPLLRSRRAADDRRLGGDLRDRRPLAERRARARASPRRDGDRVDRRARAGRRVPRARQRPPAVARRGPRQRLLRLDRGRPRGRRALLRPQAAQARGPRGHAARARRTDSVARRERFRPDLDYVEDNPLPSVRAPQERELVPHAPRGSPPLAAVSLSRRLRRPRPSLPLRADARGPGTGTSPRRRGATRTGGRPAIR